MNQAVVRWMLMGAMAALASVPIASAEEPQKTLPTLLIKGEVVSIDANDPVATLLKVKDRYGFETPIYLSQETKIAQGEQAVVASNLAAGTPVEVEYNFDINTAKRHAVNVKVSQPAPASTPAPASSDAAAPSTATPAAAAPTTEPAAPADAASAAPAAQPAAPEQPAANTTQ
jgi:hypothetical protein